MGLLSRKNSKKVLVLSILALCLALLLHGYSLYLFWVTQQNLKTPSMVAVYHTLVMVVATALSLLGVFCLFIKFSIPRLLSLSIFTIAVLTSQFELAGLLNQLSGGTTFLGSWILCGLFVVATTWKIIGAYSIRPSVLGLSLSIVASLAILWGLTGIVSSQWLSLSEMSQKIPFFRDIVLSFGVVLPIFLVPFLTPYIPDFQGPSKSWTKYLKVTSKISTDSKLQLTLGICHSVAALRLIQVFLPQDHRLAEGLHTFLAYHPILWVFGIEILSELFLILRIQQNSSLASKLLNQAALKFLFRHEKSEDAWAAIVGFQTASYLIDHDPGELIKMGMPATMRQIRTEEIQRCINTMLKDSSLHLLELGHNFHGAIDPEASLRPCLDLLRLFCCLYLDASPIVERRIKALVSLMPVIDPTLSIRLSSDDLSTLLKKNYWFFFLDFGWIDQRVTKSPKSVRYDISMGPHSAHEIMTSIKKQDRITSIGNAVWLTPESRARILQEASLLGNIIEPYPIITPGSKGEELYFLMKFEQLIPRLQRYFDLDSMRHEIIDFEPSSEGAQYLNLFSLQIEKATKKDDITPILMSIQSIPWRGFKEKDAALRLVILAHEKLLALAHSDKTLKASDVAQDIYQTIQKIGYPSQVLHMAHISKFTLRELSQLLKTAKNPDSPRFAEAWLVLATQNFAGPEIAKAVLDFILSVKQNPTLRSHQLVQMKTLEVLCNLFKSPHPMTNAEKISILESTLSWFINEDAAPELLCFFLDTLQYLQQDRTELKLSKASLDTLNSHILKLSHGPKKNDPKLQMLKSRQTA